MAMTAFEPINNYASITMRKRPEAKGDILLPDSAQKTPRWGTVKNTGPGVYDMGGKLTKSLLEVDDLVYCMAHGKEPIPMADMGVNEDLWIISELDVLCKLKNEDSLMASTTGAAFNPDLSPLGDWIEVEKIEPVIPEDKILLPDHRRTPPAWGKVVAVGEGWRAYDGQDIPFQVNVGDIVSYDPWRCVIVDFSDLGHPNMKRYLIAHGDIYGRLKQ